MQKYLTDCYQKTEVNNVYNSWSEIISGFPQGSILGSPFSNRFLNYLFLYAKEKFSSDYPGDNTLYAIGNRIDKS